MLVHKVGVGGVVELFCGVGSLIGMFDCLVLLEMKKNFGGYSWWKGGSFRNWYVSGCKMI